MPRTRRLTPGGVIYHVLNRANARLKIFSGRADYEEFVQAMHESLEHVPIRVLSWCLMPDHWHLVLWPKREGELSEFMRRLSVTHTRRWHARHNSSGSGHLYQGNAVRAKMVKKATDWPWSSVHERAGGPRHNGKTSGPAAPGAIERPALSDWPVQTPRGWAARVDATLSGDDLAALRKSVQRGTPFGSAAWQAKIAGRLNLQSTMRARGRPRKHPLPVESTPAAAVKPSRKTAGKR
jgi:putative transposase